MAPAEEHPSFGCYGPNNPLSCNNIITNGRYYCAGLPASTNSTKPKTNEQIDVSLLGITFIHRSIYCHKRKFNVNVSFIYDTTWVRHSRTDWVHHSVPLISIFVSTGKPLKTLIYGSK